MTGKEKGLNLIEEGEKLLEGSDSKKLAELENDAKNYKSKVKTFCEKYIHKKILPFVQIDTISRSEILSMILNTEKDLTTNQYLERQKRRNELKQKISETIEELRIELEEIDSE